MKQLLFTTVAAVVLVGCATTQSPEPPTAKAPDISIHEAAMQRNLEAVKQHIAAGTDVNAKDVNGYTPLDWTIFNKDTKTVDLLRKHGGKTGEELKAAAD
ncbi:ankyrin repeat domain-containing protein [bacterium]|nr:ankyrin repeat domain-containing protein [bacterium]MDA7675386.1 ankyrin repeat domain-containing protein [bacterium]MDB4668521.1 ankyrin repeat domain-containing protein [bacterium]MDC0309548.1 ankyrin repeat domain-containing protein [bacterium]